MFLCPAVKMEEAVSMEMDNHVLDKEEGCYDHTEAAFSDDEEEVNNKGRKTEKIHYNPRVLQVGGGGHLWPLD